MSTLPFFAYDATVLREPFTGVEIAVHELACALARRTPFPLVVHLPRDIERFRPDAPQAQWLEHRIPFQSRLWRIAWQQLVLPGWLSRHKPALLHAPAYVAPLHLPCPLVLTLYDLHVYSHPQTCRSLNRWHYRAVMPRTIRRAAALIVPSYHTLNRLRDHFGEAVAAKAEVIPLGVSDAFRPITDSARLAEARRRYGLPERFIVFVGNLAPRKNLPLLFAAWQQARLIRPELGLVLAGQSTTSARLPNLPDLHALGYVPAADLPLLYAMAQALVFPSIDEGYGLPTLEAMACGCPVICSGGAPSEIAPQAVLSPDPTPDALSRAILQLAGDADLRLSLTQTGLQAASERSWDRTAQRTLTLYARVAGLAGSQQFSI